MRTFIFSIFVLLVSCVLPAQTATALGGPQSSQIAKRTDRKIDVLSPRSKGNRDLVVYAADASFIKLHFKHFNPGKNTIIEISNPDGTEFYRYSKDKKGPMTFDKEAGDDGKNSFSAMSITGDTAIIRVLKTTKNGKALKRPARSLKNHVFIDYFVEGLPESDRSQTEPSLEMGTFNQSIESDSLSPRKSKSGESVIESVCGLDERYDAVCWEGDHPDEFDSSRPVAMIVAGYKSCTAWRVGPDNRLFTNNHCIASQSETSAAEVWFNFQSSTCGGSEFGDIVKVSADELLSTDYTLDYSLFSVNDFSRIEAFGNLGLDVRDGVLGEKIYIPQHGGSDPKQMAIESDMDLDGLCQIDDTDVDARDTGSDLGYFCDTIGGSSGAPVISMDSHKVVALHHYGGCFNSGAKMTLIWKKVSRFFNRVIPEGDWSGPPPNPQPNPNTDPVANFSYACDQLSCSFDGGSSSDSDGSIVAYSWDFGDGGTGNGASFNHVFTSEGTYLVTLSVQDNNGGTDTKSSTLQLGSVTSPPPSISLNGTANKQKGNKLATLTWSGAEASLIEIYRNGMLLIITSNDGEFIDESLSNRDKSATYKVCDEGQVSCSNEITLTF